MPRSPVLSPLIGAQRPLPRFNGDRSLCLDPEIARARQIKLWNLREKMRKGFEIRLASVAEAEIVSRHRARMFHEMGLVPDHLFESYRTQCEARLREMLATGEYIGWLAHPVAQPDKIVAGVGVQLRRTLPHPVGQPGGEIVIAEGRHAIVINVFTEPDWRRRGLATFLDETPHRVGSRGTSRPSCASRLRRGPPRL